MSTKRKHFHSFDAMRFFSFLLVFFHHIPVSETSPASYFTKSGGVGVSFFFVLSGFLITYILLYEKLTHGKISLKKFFFRRILRIWPLFYAMILFAFITPYILDYLNISHSGEGYDPDWLMSVLFLENYKMMLTGGFPNVSPLGVMWSLCIEEHFYILWGISLYFISLKRVPLFIIISILVANIFRIVYGYYGINSLDVFSNFDFFAFGAIPAYILLFKSKILEALHGIKPYFKYLWVVITVAVIFAIPNFHSTLLFYLSPTVYAICFSALILFTLPEKNALFIKDSYWVSKMGIYTYGLYLFHTIVINLVFQLKGYFPFDLHWAGVAVIAFLITVLVSLISYKYFEAPFLNLKRYFYQKK